MNEKKFFLFFICFVYQFSFAQQFQFAKSIGGTGFENAMGIAVDNNKNIIVCGYFAGTADFNPSATASDSLTSAGFNDVFLAKYDSIGNYLWAIKIGGPGDEFTYADPVIDNAGSIYVCGQFNTGCDFNPDSTVQLVLINNGSFDGFIAKFTDAGNLVWAQAAGGVADDQIYRLDINNAGDVLFAGSFDSIADINPAGGILNFQSKGASDFFFGRLASNGNLKNVFALGGTGDDYLNNITHDANDNIIITGSFTDSSDFNPDTVTVNMVTGNSSSSFIAKYDSSGNYLWAFPILNSIPFGLRCSNNNEILTCGEFLGTADFNPSASTNQLTSLSNSFDVYFAKYDAGGNYVFAKRVGGTGTDNAYAIRQMHDSTILLSGYFYSTADFNPGAASNNLTAAGFGDLFVAHYDNTGNYINAFRCGAAGFDFARNFACEDDGSFFIAGGYEQTVDFNPAPAINNLVSINSSRDGFFAKYGASFTPIYSLSEGKTEIKIYPNPFTNNLTVEMLNTNNKNGVANLYDVVGKKLFSKPLKSGTNIIHLHELNQGVYFLNVNNSSSVRIIKLLGN